MDIITIDFETFYDKGYGLKSHTTEAYIRDPRFQVIGLSLKVNDDATNWYSGDRDGIASFLHQFDFSNKAILCHNTLFDGAILSWHFGVKPKLWLDTLSMARPLHNVTVGGSLKVLAEHYRIGVKGEEVLNALGKRREDFAIDEMDRYAEYCINDTDLTKKLFDKLKVGFPASELMVIDQTIRMYTEPSIVLDKQVLELHLKDVLQKKSEVMAKLGLEGMDEDSIQKVLRSNPMFAKYLENLGVAPPMKTSLTTGKETYAFSKTDKEFMELLNHPDERVSLAVSARLGVKSSIEETRTQGLLEVADRGLLPIMLNYYGAHTGRFSGGDKLNLQNFPRNGTLRKALCAPKGNVLISSDSAQIEARVVAWLAEQKDLVQAFADKRDVYSEFASEVYGRKITKADKVERFVGKTCILGLGYGMGAEKFRKTLEMGQGGVSVKIDENEAERIVRLYRQKNHKIVDLWNRCGNILQQIVNGQSGQMNTILGYNAEGITLPNKLQIKYPLLRQTSEGFAYIADARTFRKACANRLTTGGINDIEWTKIYGGKMVENIVQALARIVVAEQMVAIGQKYHVVFQVHDEIIITCKETEADEAIKSIVDVMSKPPAWAEGLPVACEADVGYNYGETK